MITLKTIRTERTIRNIVVTVLLFVSPFLYAQSQTFPSQLWHEGKIVLLAGDTLRGMVKYDMQQDLVQHAIRDKQAEAYTARKILYFEIFDETVHQYRKFFTLPFATATGYKTPIFFELLEEGPMTLLCREYLEYKTYTSMYYPTSYTRLILSYKYFFLKENGDIVEFSGNKNDLLDMMGRKADDVEKYAKANRLHFDDKRDLARIVAYYNSLAGS